MPSFEGKAKRETSGVGGSTLITSAPRSSSVRAHSGPASTREKSTTRIPLNGPLMSAPLECGEAGAVLLERRQAGLEVLRGPDRLLDLGHRKVGGDDALVGRQMGERLGGRVRYRRSVRELLGDRHRCRLEGLVGNHEVDQ